MKPILLTLLITLTVGSTFAQDGGGGGIKSTTTLHPDGTRTELQKDLGELTGEEKTFDAGNQLLHRVTYKLDANGDILSGTAFNAKGTPLYTFEYKRDGMGRISEELDYTPAGQLTRRLVYHYNSAGKVSGIDGFDAQGNPLPKASGTPAKKKGKR
jgi:hypothetical protein